MPNLYDEKSVDLSRLADEVSDILAIVENLAINPGFEAVLPGTHTDAIKKISTSDAVRNTISPGWQVCTPASAAWTVTVSTGTAITASNSSVRSVHLDVSTGYAGSYLLFRQVLGSTIAGVDQGTTIEAARFRGKVLNFAVDAKHASQLGWVRPYIYHNGTGGGSRDCGDIGTNGNGSWQRLSHALAIPDDATEIHYGLEFNSGPAGITYIDNVTVLAADSALNAESMTYKPPASKRRISGSARDGTYQFLFVAPDTSWRQSGIGASGISPDYDFNSNRPAWANAIEVFTCAYNGSASDRSAKYAPAGFTNEYLTVEGYLVNYNNGVIPLGADGQIQVAGGAAGVVSWLKILRWIGEGL